MRNWPLFGLRVRTPRLELRLPGLGDLDALADLAAEGIHDPATMPFGAPWTAAPPAERARTTLQFHWRSWAEWTPDNWSCDLITVHDGTVIGTQGFRGKDFATVREISTGSWLGLPYHGKGFGTEMRAAILHLAFAGLGAEHAVSSAFTDNPASLRISEKLGYSRDGISRHERTGAAATEQRLRLTREAWTRTEDTPVEITDLTPCLPLFGITS